ncbi:hypothetical protein Ahy_A06g026189 [Arachis hypogaea]|uniref:Protein FAR1-RELATED SEQUENCE n=1 Tax=Arachis hypogaea TaxID=3818 RepID=A0A445CJP5_ARAHY|nr:hypothetical protein Ahy_A06g026189 [Arachis hypogaea]
MDTLIFEEVLYDIAYDVSEHSNSTNVNVLSLSEDDTPLVEQGKEFEVVIQKKNDATFPDHIGILIKKIPYVGLRFDSLQLAQESYCNYVKKVGFVTRIKNTNFDKTKKESKNNNEAGIRANKTYLALANEVVDVDKTNKFKSALWVDARCRASYEYFGDVVSFDTMYSRNKHGLLFASFISVNHHGKSTLLGCALLGNKEIRSLEWIFKHWLKWMGTTHRPSSRTSANSCLVLLGMSSQILDTDDLYDERRISCISMTMCLGTKSKKKLEDDAADSKGVVPCSSSSIIKRQFQREYTTSKFREVQHEFRKKRDCLVHGVTQEGDLFRVTVNEQYLLYGEPRSWTYSVEFDPETHKVRCECNMFGSRDFVICKEEAAMLHSGLDQLRSKLLDYRANLGSRRVPTIQNSTVTQRDPALGESDIQGPSKVSTKGRPRLKRLGSELDTSIKKYMRR